MHGSYTQIVALDLGKFNSIVCLFDVAANAHRFQSIVTTPMAVHDVLASLIGMPEDVAKILVVFETCEISGWVHDIASALGLAVAVANPCHEAWQWRKVKRKTDKDDALTLAWMTLMDQLPTVHMPPPQMRQRRRLVHHHHSLIQRRTRSKNQVRSIFAQQGLALPVRGGCWTNAGIAQLQQDARPLVDCDELNLWRGRLSVELALIKSTNTEIALIERKLESIGSADPRVTLLTSIPGVGRCLAEVVVVHLDDVTRFKSAGHVSSYAGLVPKQMDSGLMQRSGRITRRGPRLLRGMLVEVAWGLCDGPTAAGECLPVRRHRFRLALHRMNGHEPAPRADRLVVQEDVRLRKKRDEARSNAKFLSDRSSVLAAAGTPAVQLRPIRVE